MKCDFLTHNFTESMFTPEKANFFRISFFVENCRSAKTGRLEPVKGRSEEKGAGS